MQPWLDTFRENCAPGFLDRPVPGWYNEEKSTERRRFL